MQPKHDVFISYSRKSNSDFANVLRAALELAQLDVWMDRGGIAEGFEWEREIQKALHNCRVMLLVISQASMDSENVQDEIATAIRQGVAILPIQVEELRADTEYPMRLNRVQWMNAKENQSQSRLDEIVLAARRVLNAKSPPAVPGAQAEQKTTVAKSIDRTQNDFEATDLESDALISQPPTSSLPVSAAPTLQRIFDAKGPKKNLILNAVRAGASDLESADRSGRTALHYAAENFETDWDVMALLLERGANVNARDKNGVTPLHLAVADVDLARLLILKGADFEARDKTDQTPLAYASRLKPTLVTQTKNLLQLHADIKRGDKTPNSALQEAMAMERRQSDRILDAIAAGADDVQMRDAFGRTALHWAAQENEPELVQLLLERGADINALESRGNTPEQLAHIKSATKAIEILRAWEHSHPVDQRKPKVADEPRAPIKANEAPQSEATFKYDVFLSYSSKNELFADNVFNALKTSGLRVWMDRESIPGGAKWEQGITEALDNSRMMLVIVSQASMTSKWVGREILVADELDKRILPVKIEEPSTRIPLCLREVQELNLVGNQSRSMVNRIVSATEEMLSSLESEQAPPDELVTEAPLPANVANERLQKVLQSKGRWKAEAIMRAIKNGATDFSFTDQRGRTALHWAAKEGNTDAMKIALDNGADVNALSNDGVTPLGWAKASIETGGVLAVVTQVLKKHGASG